MVRINWRTSLGTAGRPCLPRRTFQAQNRRKPCRCQPITVEALMIKTLDCQSFQTALSQAHKNRSAGVSLGRLTERCRTPSGWRRARISSCSAARLRKESKSAVKKADNRCPKENRRKKDNSQFINQIGVCENRRQRLRLEASLYQILQILSLTLFEKVPILQALQPPVSQNESGEDPNQLILFDF